MSTLLIVGASALQHYIYTKAREAGLRVCSVDGNHRAPMFAMADDYRVIDFRDTAAVVRYAQQMSIDAVAAINLDQGMNHVARITTALGLPGPDPDAVLLSTQKDLMRKQWSSSSVPQPHYQVFDSSERDLAIHFLRRGSQKFIIKPVDNAAKRGISIYSPWRNPESLVTRAFRASRAGRIIIENFVDGELIFAATYIPKNGTEPLVHLMRQTSNGIVQVQFDSPHSFGSDIDRRIRDVAVEAASPFGTGPFHTEMIVDREAQPHLVETSPRVSYATVSLSRLTYGFDPVAAVLNEATESPLLPTETRSQLHARLEHLQPKEGSVFRRAGRIHLPDTALHEVVPLVRNGHRSRPFETNDDRVMYFTVTGRDPDDVQQNAILARGALLSAHFASDSDRSPDVKDLR